MKNKEKREIYFFDRLAKLISEDAEVLDALKAEGVTIIEVEDKTPWIAAVQDVLTNNINGEDAALEQILSMK